MGVCNLNAKVSIITIKYFRLRQLFILFSLFMIYTLLPYTFTRAVSFHFTSFKVLHEWVTFEFSTTIGYLGPAIDVDVAVAAVVAVVGFRVFKERNVGNDRLLLLLLSELRHLENGPAMAAEHCVLHKDIKSSNIMLNSNFNVKLGDFELARLVDHAKASQITDLLAYGRKPINHSAPKDQVKVLCERGEVLNTTDKRLGVCFDEQYLKISIMAVYNLTIKHFQFRQLSILLSLFMITNFFSVLTPFTFASALSFNFPSFSFLDPNISYEQNAYADEHQVIELTGNETWRVGRATYFRPMHLWDKNSKNLTDFATHFSFVIDSQNQPSYADGIAFFLAPNGSKTSTATKGAYLGLCDPNSSNHFVAVEFDIWHNEWDPPGEHVGIDINSMKSFATASWLSNITIMEGKINEAWISYNSSSYNLSVVFTGFKNNVVVNQSLSYTVDLRIYLPEWVTFGFSAGRGSNYAVHHTIHSWNFSSSLEIDNSNTDPNDPNPVLRSSTLIRTWKLPVLVIVGVLILVGGLATVLFALWKRKWREWESCVLHRDIKSSNIMLDSNFNARLGDFGLARIVDHARGSLTTNLAGTQGYIDPRCVITRKASKESDIYSFGIVALELACGRKPVIHEAPEDQVVMLEWVRELHGRGEVLNAADQRLGGNFDEQQMKCLLNVGLWCAHFEYDRRPSIREAIQVLNFEAPLPLLQLDTPRSLYRTPTMNEAVASLSTSNGATNSTG
ncbi:l-type lectin-domain containing receptor kinase ix.1 [Quercus suber]|uniref:L-type lectin-domain containing receptor kinase ix.1 n=1 Tax=Quercus suber TaxID=58331 RepID=A0AAW0LP30_QUESU